MALYEDETVKLSTMWVSNDISNRIVNTNMKRLIVVMAAQLQVLLSIVDGNMLAGWILCMISIQHISFIKKTQ